jgi:hypothetical protein
MQGSKAIKPKTRGILNVPKRRGLRPLEHLFGRIQLRCKISSQEIQLPVYRIAEHQLQKLPETTFAAESLLERKDLQRLIQNDLGVLGKDLKLIAEEFTNWEDSDRRIDLLCIDKNARLVVVEIKRTTDGGHMELQAIRCAAMVSSMTFEQVVNALARTLNDQDPIAQARAELFSFLDWDSDDALDGDVSIILASADFSVEITTAVLWLNKKGLDITCIRVKPYRLGSEVLMDVQQIIPLPEAADYEVKIREQERENKKIRSANEATWSGSWYSNVGEGPSRSWEDMRKYGFVAAGGGPRWIRPLQKLRQGDGVYAYQKGAGYVGYGEVTTPAIPANEFRVEGTLIGRLPLQQPGLLHDVNSPEVTEWVAGVKWHKTVSVPEAKTFNGVFANQASVCKLRHIETLEFLKGLFGD